DCCRVRAPDDEDRGRGGLGDWRGAGAADAGRGRTARRRPSGGRGAPEGGGGGQRPRRVHLRRRAGEAAAGGSGSQSRSQVRGQPTARASALARPPLRPRPPPVGASVGTMIHAAADPKKAITVLRVAEQELSQMRSCEPCSMGYLTSAATASARAGELDRARSFLAEAERIAGMWQGGLWTGAVWEARAILRQAEGEGEQAHAMFREAAQAFARAGNQSDAARCLEAAAGL